MNERARQLLEEGLRHHVLGDDQKAAACFTKILDADPANEKAIRLLEMIRRPKGGAAPASRADPPARSAGAVPVERAPAPEAAGARDAAPPAPRARREGERPEDAEIAALMKTVEELHSLGDFSGSLQAAEKVLAKAPGHTLAQDYLARNRKTLTHFYESKLGSVGARPKVAIRPDEILWLNIDHRGGFLLSQIDGSLSVEDLYALSGMSRMETAKILAELLADGVIEMD